MYKTKQIKVNLNGKTVICEVDKRTRIHQLKKQTFWTRYHACRGSHMSPMSFSDDNQLTKTVWPSGETGTSANREESPQFEGHLRCIRQLQICGNKSKFVSQIISE